MAPVNGVAMVHSGIGSKLSDRTDIGCFAKRGVCVDCRPHGGDSDALTVDLPIPSTMLRSVHFDGERLQFDVLGAVERQELARTFRWLADRIERAGAALTGDPRRSATRH